MGNKSGATRARGWAGAAVTAALAFSVLLASGPAAGEPRRAVGDVLSELALDPSVEEVQRAALEQAALDPERMRSLLGRLRWASTLPRIEVSVVRGLERDEDLDRGYQQWDDLSVATDDDLDLRCTLRWDLDRLVYDPEELRAVRQAADLSRRRRELLLSVTRLYFELVLLRAQARLGREETPEERLERALRTAELTAVLDGLTGGLLSATATRARGPRPR